MGEKKKSYKQYAEEAEQRMLHYNTILESARELKINWLKIFAEEKIEEEIDRNKRFRIAQEWDQEFEAKERASKYTPDVIGQMHEEFMQKHGLTELKRYVCLKDYKKAQRGDMVKQSFNIEGDILYFGNNDNNESFWLYPKEVENSSNFAEIGVE